jgi:hypothetical protein
MRDSSPNYDAAGLYVTVAALGGLDASFALFGFME